MENILRNDAVIVIAGRNKGKTGRVLRVIRDKNRILIEGVGMIKKHVKPNPQANVKGGIAEQESPIHLSNVALLDRTGKATRVGTRVVDGARERYAKTTGEALIVGKHK